MGAPLLRLQRAVGHGGRALGRAVGAAGTRHQAGALGRGLQQPAQGQAVNDGEIHLH